jgi:hypothetical protein
MKKFYKIKLLDFDGYELTEQSKESMYNYFMYGLEPGGFMTSVLSNDLCGAASRADFENRKRLHVYAAWLINHAPYQSYGSPEIVRGWLSKNEYYHQFQKELVAERLQQPE